MVLAVALWITAERLPLGRHMYAIGANEKAAALNEEELKREVESMETEVRELEAWVKVQQAVHQLHEVVAKHPNTKAAETANAAIQLIEERRVSVGVRTASFAEVRSGLAEGDQVVVGDRSGLAPGTAVSPKTVDSPAPE